MAGFIDQLRDIAGEAHVGTDPDDLAMRNGDGRGDLGACLACVRPGSADEVAAISRLATLHDIRIVPQGARTGLVGGATGSADATMVLLSLDRLARTLSVDPVNRTVIADAGVRLSALNEAAARHGLTFPIDLGADPSVGGMIAANTGGARFLRFGDVRRNLLGIDAVLADGNGTRVSLGGALWKDNSGLDLKQMLAGSGGSLGIVTRATLALQPLPGARVTALLALDDAGAVETLLGSLESACGALLTAFEGISPAAYEAALGHVGRLRRPFAAGSAAYFLLIELSAGSALSDGYLEEMLASVLAHDMAPEGPLVDVAIDRTASLWDIRHAVPEGLQALGTVTGCDISLRRGDLSAFREIVGAELGALFPGFRLCDFGHVGDGGLHFNLVWPHSLGTPPEGASERARDHIFSAAVERFGGSFSAEHGIGPRNIHYYDRWTPPAIRTLAAQVQRAFAPAGIGRVNF